MAASGETTSYQLPYPLQTDAVDVAGDMQLLAEKVEEKLLLKSNLISPNFTGTPLAPTASVDISTNQIATTAFVINQGYIKSADAFSTYAPLSSPALTGNPTATTQSLGNSSTRIATTAFVANTVNNSISGITGLLPSQSYPETNEKFLSSDGANASWSGIQISNVDNLQTSLNNLTPLNRSFISSSETLYPLQLTDAYKQVEMTSSSANTVYVPKDASVNFPIGTTITIASMGTGQTTIIAQEDSITTVLVTENNYRLRTRYSVATLVKRAANQWLLYGDLSS
jgi:hypothetical protein